MQIRDKILACVTVALALVLVTAVLATWQINLIDRAYRGILDERVAAVSEAQKMLSAYEYMALMMRTYLLTGDPEYKKEYEAQAGKLEEHLTGLARLVRGPEDQAAFDRLVAQFRDFRQKYAEPIIAVWSRPDLTDDEKKDLVTRITLERKGTVRALIKATDDFVALEEKLLRREAEVCETRARHTALAVLFSGLAAVLLGIGGAVFAAVRIAAPVRRLEQEVVRVATGDLAVSDLAPRGEDEISRLTHSFNLMLGSLRETVELLRSQARGMEEARSELQRQAESLADGLVQTAGAAETLGSRVDGLRAFYQEQVADKVTDLNKAGVHAEEARQRLLELAETAWQSTTGIGERLRELDESVEKVTRVVEFINYMAIRTGDLAKEVKAPAAAAQEVSTLAEQVKGALGEITGVAAAIRTHTEEIVNAVRENISLSQELQRVIQETGVALRAVLDEGQELAVETSRTGVLAQEIGVPAQKVMQAVKEQSALLEKVVITAERLRAMAEQVRQVVARFKLPEDTGDGGNGPAATAG